jgi:uncharacterized protein (DUF58 family)
MIQPTRRAVLLFAAGLPIPWLLVVVDGALWTFAFNYSILVLLMIAIDAVISHPRHLINVTLEVPRRAFIGDRVEIAVLLAVSKYRTPADTSVALELAGEIEPRAETTIPLIQGTAARGSINILPRRRGTVRVVKAFVRWRGPFGLVQQVRAFQVDQSMDVLPNPRSSRVTGIEFFSRDAMLGLKAQREKGGGSEFQALKEYAPGLDHRFIDWKHSARHRKLLCKEFKAESNHPILLVFDTGYLMREPLDGLPRLDHAVNAGLLLAWAAVRTGDLVGTFAFDSRVRQYVAPLRGAQGFRYLQQAAATLPYSVDETNFTLGIAELRMRTRRRSLLVLFTEFVDTTTAELLVENVQSLTANHLIVFVTLRDPAIPRLSAARPDSMHQVASSVLAYDLMRERNIVLGRLQRIGVHTLDVSTNTITPQLLNRYLLIKQRGLL